VVLNEAIELARRFSAPDAGRFVNGVLDGIRRTLDTGAVRPADRGDE
jgi:N utilization substance protein B